MSVRAQTLDSKKWGTKAPSYIAEALYFNIKVLPPDINKSNIEFTINGTNIYFGLTAIKGLGYTAAQKILNKRTIPFKSIFDFIQRTKVNKNILENLIKVGAFDSLGYTRKEALETINQYYDYIEISKEINERIIENEQRLKENIEIERTILIRDQLRKDSKKRELTEDEKVFLENNKRILTKKQLAVPELPVLPEPSRSKVIHVSFVEMLEQGTILGCFLNNPSRMMFPDSEPIGDIDAKGMYTICGVVDKIKSYKNKDGSYKHYLNINDGTSSTQISITNKNKTADELKYKVISASVFAGPEEIYDEEDILISKELKVYKTYKITESK